MGQRKREKVGVKIKIREEVESQRGVGRIGKLRTGANLSV
jgi:hypothetical protein